MSSTASSRPAAARAGGKSLSDRVLLVLRTMIEEGQIRPGERLMEAQVVKAFGVSRSPARAALNSLSEEGVIESDGARGFRVSGEGAPAHAGKLAALDNVRVAMPRQWERMYAEVEKEINVQALFGSARINENELASYYGVSRTVTRDVLARMHSVGLISKARGGHWVAEYVSPERIRDLFEVRTILEPAALRRAAPHVTAEELSAALHHIAVARRRETIESAEFDRTETDLHIQLLSHCPNREILGALNRTHVLFVPTRHLGDPFLGVPMELIRDALDEHTAIIRSILAGDLDQACALLVDHIEKAHGRWLQRLAISSHVAQLKSPPYLSKLSD